MRVYHGIKHLEDESIPFQAQVQKYIYGSRLFSCCLFIFVGGENLLPLLSTGWLQNGFEHGVICINYNVTELSIDDVQS